MPAQSTPKFQQAVQLLQQGYGEAAQSLCHDVLAAQPNHVEALHLLGVIHLQRGAARSGADYLGRALSLDPRQPFAHSNMALALLELRRPQEALLSCDRALALKPDLAEAHFNRGNALRDLRRHEDALRSYDRALELGAQSPDVLYNRGNLLLELDRPAQALESYERAITLRPAFPEALTNAGKALLDLRRAEEARDCLERALRLKPDFLPALNNLGSALRILQRHEEALASYERALSAKPDYVEALANRGNVLLERKDTDRALASCQRALEIRPDFPRALNLQGNLLLDLQRPHEAAACFARLLEVAPETDYALGSLVQAELKCCRWSAHEERNGRVLDAVLAGKRGSDPFYFLAMSASALAQLRCAQSFAADKCPVVRPALWQGERYAHRRIRLAYVSADFREHPVAGLMVGVLERHDRERFETLGVSLRAPEPSPMGRRIRAAFDEFVDVSTVSDRAAAELLHAREVDIAIDLTGYTNGMRPGIFAHRAVPLQVNYLGFPGTLGSAHMDYILADEFVIPPASRTHYSEQVIYLPECFQANDDRRIRGDGAASRAAAGFAPDAIVLCSFNATYKLTPQFFAIWMRVLKQVPAAVLWLAEDNAQAARSLHKQARQHGVNAERLIIDGRVPYSQYLARVSHADLFLDTLPFNAGTTASDALWAGVPVLTCAGDAFAARMAGSLLRAAGLPELVTHTAAQYEELALQLASSAARLQELRRRLLEQRADCPLFNTERFCRHLEAAYCEITARCERGEAPRELCVPPLPSSATVIQG